MSLLVVAFLGVWLVLSMLAVARVRWMLRGRRGHLFPMLSDWHLFITGEDAHPSARRVLYRDWRRDGSFCAPLPVESGTIDWTPRIVVWEPRWDAAVLVRRLAKELQREQQHASGAVEQLRAYRHLRHIVRRYPRSVEDANARQFLVLSTYGEHSRKPPGLLFESAVHPL